MPISVDRCPLCQQTQSSLFDRRSFKGQEITNRLCTNCGLVYQSPRMSDGELEAFYQEEYRQLYQGSQGPNNQDLATQEARAKHLLSLVEDTVPHIARHLDIGCSAGLLLVQFRQHYKDEAVGIEPGRAYREYAQTQKLVVYASLDELQAHEEETFDFISMAHVLEHIADPVDYLAGLRKHFLKSDGWLLVEVPNLYGHDCFETAHLVSYSAHTLGQVLNQAGFSVHFLKTHGMPRSAILPLYITVLAQADHAQPVSEILPESGVRRKRAVGLFKRKIQTRLNPGKAWLPKSRIR
jgi:2-polyprenyl-3-methyl-5-hydroxy-6-metoxy-1,4-benzoquinol methylase